ncbi:hypothetical protein DFH27DRAFT_615740 [Peziza echinospora]|nr:hypothetical protein DFH27DRAFT_615740 [Peziza echinospora]
MTGYYSHSAEIPRLATSSAALHNDLSSPGPNSAPASMSASASFLSSRFDQSPMPTFFVSDGSMPKNPRIRRKSIAGMEQVKHRRTRSGCFTCRGRRVKCDETRPTCERCQKGGRECAYPEVMPPTKSSASRKRAESSTRDASSSLSELEEEDGEMMQTQGGSSSAGPSPSLIATPKGEPLRRDSWPAHVDRGLRAVKSRVGSLYEHTPSPQADSSLNYSESSLPTSPAPSIRRPASHTSLVNSSRISHLPHEIQFYINFHWQKLSHTHYLIKTDCDHFFKTTLIDHALHYEPLLYAVVAFSAFHYCVGNKVGALQSFLPYYNQSVSLLREKLNQPCTIATLITILQLASFEEYLGDWRNLMQHHVAAASIIKDIFTPESMTHTSERRIIYTWFSRFDIYAAMMAGHSTTLDRSWSKLNRDFYERDAQQNPHDLHKKIEYNIAKLRDLAMDMTLLIAGRAQCTISLTELGRDAIILRDRYIAWWKELDPILLENPDPVPAHGSGGAEDPFLPAYIYNGARWGVNLMLLDYYGLTMLMSHHMPTGMEEIPGAKVDVHEAALAASRILSAIQASDAPPGALLPTQATVALVALWLPQNDVYQAWARKQLATIEQQGYIYPRAFRNKIAELWGNSDLISTWSETHSDSSMTGVISRFMDGRAQEMSGQEPVVDPVGEDITEMRALLTDLNLSSPSQSQSPATVTSSVYGSPEQINAATHASPDSIHGQSIEKAQGDIYRSFGH